MTDKIPIKDVTPVKIHQPTAQRTDRPRGRIYVRAVEGVLEKLRRSFGFLFLGLFAIIPWLEFNGHQAVLFDIAAQRFHIFGLTLFPQDLTLLAWLFIIAAFALFFVTTFAGRVWCGFMCPQTTWTFIFMWFEEQFEGSANKRMKLDARPMDVDKFWRKTAKQTAWWSVALLTSLVFVGYFMPIDQLFYDFFTLELGFWPLFWVAFFTLCTYGNAGYMREIMCTHICPYARFQSAMFDQDTYTVAYDAGRGEKRGPRPRKMPRELLRQEQGLGDCIDCNLCVQVCPTGIDIRNGLQYECINCGLCVDACNGVMDKMNYPRGLIRFTSERNLSGGKTRVLRPKLAAYGVVMALMLGLFVMEVTQRVPLHVDILRDRNALFRETSDGLIENVYTLKLMNMSQRASEYRISVDGLSDYRLIGKRQINIAAGEVLTLPLSIAVDPYALASPITDITFKVQALNQEQSVQVSQPSRFIYR